MLRAICIVGLFSIMGCAASKKSSGSSAMNEPPTVPPPSVVSLGHSVKGAPITMQIFGAGGRTIFIMAGIHGDESQSVELAEKLTIWIEQHPDQIANRRVAILRVANPDGYAAGHRVNANGVDLNRNFPAKNYEAARRYGNTPASQPETRAIIAAIDQLKPDLIVSIHCINGGRQCNNYDGPAKTVGELMSQSNHYPVEATIGYPTPGSLGSYAGIDRQIPMITLELPYAKLSEQGWIDNREALMAAIRNAE